MNPIYKILIIKIMQKIIDIAGELVKEILKNILESKYPPGSQDSDETDQGRQQ